MIKMKYNKGFTLLEVLLSLAIFSLSMGWLLIAQSQSVKRSQKSRLLSQAIYLANSKMIETEATLRKDGFGDFEDELCGDFESEDYEGSDKFSYCVYIDKIEMPDVGLLQEKLLGNQTQVSDDSETENEENPDNSMLSGLLGQFMGGDSEASSNIAAMASSFLAPMMGMIQGVLEESIRKITVRIIWVAGKQEQHMELVSYITDPEHINQAIMQGMSNALSDQNGASGTNSNLTNTSGSTRK